MLPSKEILSQSETEDYVGGLGVWQDLMKFYGPKKHRAVELIPFRVTPGGHRKWKRSEIDQILDIAQEEGTLRAVVKDDKREKVGSG